MTIILALAGILRFVGADRLGWGRLLRKTQRGALFPVPQGSGKRSRLPKGRWLVATLLNRTSR
jgi:hypothetical protein